MKIKGSNKKAYFPNSMVCMCDECYELYGVKDVKIDSDAMWAVGKCPRYGCYGTLVEIDEMIAPMIRELNNKGYITDFCCSGHPGSTTCSSYSYISFKHAPESKPPKFWFWDKKNPKVLRAHKGSIYLRMYSLEKWVDELEESKVKVRRLILKDGSAE